MEYADATGALRRSYDDMQSVLQVPWVMFAARSLAVFGGYVPAAWQAAAPVFGTESVERAADDLRALAILPGADPPDPRPRLAEIGFGAAPLDEVRGALHALNYGNVKYLQLITAWCEAIQGRPSGGTVGNGPPGAPLPSGKPEQMAELTLLDPGTASEHVTGLLTRVAELHLHHAPSSDFRVLAGWPDFLQVALDDVLGPVVRTPPYETTALALLGRARAHVRGFPGPAGLLPEQALTVCTEAEVAAVTGLLALFQRFILDITIDMIRCTQALDGRQAAASSPFPVR